MKEFEVVEKKVIGIDRYYSIRGIKDTGDKKTVVKEQLFSYRPDEQDIAQFLYDNKEVSFCVVEECYSVGLEVKA